MLALNESKRRMMIM